MSPRYRNALEKKSTLCDAASTLRITAVNSFFTNTKSAVPTNLTVLRQPNVVQDTKDNLPGDFEARCSHTSC